MAGLSFVCRFLPIELTAAAQRGTGFVGQHLISAFISACVLAGCGSPEERANEHLAAAQEFFDAGNYAKANLEARNAVQIQPRNARARFLLAEIAEQQQDYQGVFGHLMVAVVIAQEMQRKFGGDTLTDLQDAVAAYRKRLASF